MRKKFWTVLLTVVLMGGLASLAVGKEKSADKAGKPGAIVTDVTSLTATVKSVDLQKRTVTLEGKGGKTVTLHTPNARNLDQVRIGDKVKVDYVEEMAIFVTKGDQAVGASDVQTVALAPKGAKPGGIIANTTEVQANVKDINYQKRTITLETPEGEIKSFKVDKSVKRFKEVKKGDQVVLRYTQAIALDVTKP